MDWANVALDAPPGARPCVLGNPGAPLTAPRPQVAPLPDSSTNQHDPSRCSVSIYPVCSYSEVFPNLVGGFWLRGSADQMLESLAAWEQVLCHENTRQQHAEHEHPEVLDSESIALERKQCGCDWRTKSLCSPEPTTIRLAGSSHKFSMICILQHSSSSRP